VVLALVVVNFGARLIVRLASGESDPAAFNTALASLLAMGVVLAVGGFLSSRRYQPARTAGDLFFEILIGAVLVTIVGPFVSGGTPFGSGSYAYVMQLLVCVGALIVGGLIGVLLAIAFGVDPKTRAWGAYAASVKLPAKPARQGKSPRQSAKPTGPAKKATAPAKKAGPQAKKAGAKR
jgi:hypothetical protein